MERVETGFDVDGDRCAAWLVRPSGAERSVPVVVMAHGLGGTRRMGLLPFAERFADAGYACLVFDYRGFGDSDGEPRQVISARQQLRDWRAAVSHARSLAGADGRVALWGTSFSGGHALAIGAEDPGLAAVMVQGPATDGLASALAIGVGATLRLAPHVVRDLARAATRREPHLVPTAGAPGSTALMTTPDAVPGTRFLVGDADVRTEAAARIGLTIMAHRPGRLASRVQAPLLALVCSRDQITPPRPALRQLARAPRGDVRTLDLDHFGVYSGAGFEAAVAAQTTFLREHVPLGRGEGSRTHRGGRALGPMSNPWVGGTEDSTSRPDTGPDVEPLGSATEGICV